MQAVLQFLLNNSIPLTLLIPAGGWAYGFWRDNFKTSDTEGIDVVARWCYLQRRRAGKNTAYIEYPEYTEPDQLRVFLWPGMSESGKTEVYMVDRDEYFSSWASRKSVYQLKSIRNPRPEEIKDLKQEAK